MQTTLASRQLTLGWIAIITLVISAAIAPIFIRFAQGEGVPSLSIIIWRLVMAALVMTPFAWRTNGQAIRQMSVSDWFWASAAGLFHLLGLVCLFFALENTTVFVNGILRRTSPLWTILLEIFLLRAVFSKWTWAGVFITLLGGLVIVFSGVETIDVGNRPVLGASLSLLNAVTLSIYIIIGRQIRNRLPFMAYTWVLFSSAAVFALIFGAFTQTPLWGFSRTGYVWVVIIAIVAQLIGHLTANYSVRIFPATYVTILLQSSVVFSAIVAYFYFGEIPTTSQLVGSGVIILGVAMLRGEKPVAVQDEPPPRPA